MKASMKKSIKYAALDLGWFVVTLSIANWIYFKFPMISLEGLGILFLGASAYILGAELIDQRKKTIKIKI